MGCTDSSSPLTVAFETMHKIIICYLDFPPAGSAFYAADKQKKRAEKVNKLSSRLQFKISKKQYGK